MPTSARARLSAIILLVLVTTLAGQSAPQPVSRAEQTDFAETSRYEDVRRFIAELTPKAPLVHVASFGKSEEGRDLPLMVISEPRITTPQQALDSRRPIVFVMANIHAGEVEGKEAVLHLARRLTLGDLEPLARGIVWLLAPIYNADGNERISLANRTEQHGPIGGVGTRENAKGLDLNRDFVKLESAEARSLVGLLTRWTPDVVVDLHTTNGSYHGYHLTYAPPLNPNADARLTAFLRQRLLPAVTKAMSSKHGFRTYYYGNFSSSGSLDSELLTPDSSSAGFPVWRTFDHRPRFGNNYVGLRNTLAVLSEAYSYLDFKGRVRATEAFVEEIGRFVMANAGDVRSLIDRTNTDSLRGQPAESGVAFELRRVPEPVDILVGAVEKKANPRSGAQMVAMIETAAKPVRMPDYGEFQASQRRRVPEAYVIPASQTGLSRTIAAKLKDHGIVVEELTAPAKMTVERFLVDSVRRADATFQGHNEISVMGRFERADLTVPAGTVVVKTNQRLGRLVAYLLEPESDDSLATWNLLDTDLKAGAIHPVLKSLSK